METIWKFPIPVEDRFEVKMPAAAQVLTVQIQRGQPCIWARVAPALPEVSRHFRIYGTGHPMIDPDGGLRYVGTFQMLDGDLVWHLFEEAP